MDGDSDVSEDQPDQPESTPSGDKKSTRFSLAQKAHLDSLYNNGMRSTSKVHSSLIEQAAADTNLTTTQVKVRKLAGLGS